MYFVHINLASASGAQTDAALVPDPGDSYRVVPRMVIMSSDAAINALIEEGSTAKLRLYLPANGGAVIVGGPDQELFYVTPSTALTYTTSGAANFWLTIGYDLKRA